ncbi:DUF2188 domain-containing protein [Paenibacillus sp. J31TS4]|uniref:DUF2188 domain-containing protein n=1 Tax=Paenibacillus sp. J31TS4 TaxID=2807195 RepID=UPI0020BE918B|nr:DUF2188 domain-containing protein [Paenibacillus sp. J31TS4]
MRDKAIDIANALLKDDYEEGRAIAIGISQAEKWDEDHPAGGSRDREDSRSDKESESHGQHSRGDQNGGSSEASSRGDDDHRGRNGRTPPGHGPDDAPNYHVVPKDGEWNVKEEKRDKPAASADSKREAVREAKELAEDAGSRVYVHNEHGRIEKTIKPDD